MLFHVVSKLWPQPTLVLHGQPFIRNIVLIVAFATRLNKQSIIFFSPIGSVVYIQWLYSEIISSVPVLVSVHMTCTPTLQTTQRTGHMTQWKDRNGANNS